MHETPRPVDHGPEEPPLPATLGFVFTLGALFAIGWFLMFMLLRARW
jgi:hypothetical protein